MTGKGVNERCGEEMMMVIKACEREKEDRGKDRREVR